MSEGETRLSQVAVGEAGDTCRIRKLFLTHVSVDALSLYVESHSLYVIFPCVGIVIYGHVAKAKESQKNDSLTSKAL